VNPPITRYAPYLWLVYLGALIFQPVFNPDTTALDWVAVVLLFAVFLPLYRATLHTRDQHRLGLLLAALAGLGLIGSLANAGAGAFAVYAAALAGRLKPIRRAFVAIAGLAAAAGQPRAELPAGGSHVRRRGCSDFCSTTVWTSGGITASVSRVWAADTSGRETPCRAVCRTPRQAGCVGEHHWSHAILPSACLDPPVGAQSFCNSARRGLHQRSAAPNGGA